MITKKIKITLFAMLLLSSYCKSQSNLGVSVPVNYGFLSENFSYCGFYNFFIGENTQLDDPKLIEFKDVISSNGYFLADTASDIQVLAMIKFEEEGTSEYVLSYLQNKDDFRIYNSSELDKYNMIVRLQNEAFWQFYNDVNDEEFGEINALKSQVKDAGDIVNLDKLAATISDNEVQLSEYLY